MYIRVRIVISIHWCKSGFRFEDVDSIVLKVKALCPDGGNIS